MISSIIDMVLLAALAGTSAAVILMYRRLQRFDALQGEAAKEFARTSAALDRAREAIAELSADGGEMAVTLAARLNEARMVMNDIDAATIRTKHAYDALPEEPVVRAAPVVHAAPHAPVQPAPSKVLALVPVQAAKPAPALVAAMLEVEEAEIEPQPEVSGTVSAAIRIRNAARARIEAAKAKAANKPAAPSPSEQEAPKPHVVQLPERFQPKIHRTEDALVAAGADDRHPGGPVMLMMKGREEAAVKTWPGIDALTGRVTWSDLARVAKQQAS